MKRLGFAVVAVLLAVGVIAVGYRLKALTALAEPASPPPATSAPSGPKAEAFRKALAEWVDLLTQIREIRMKYPNANPAEMSQLRQQYEKLVDEAQQKLPGLIAAAEAA
ncbi:MAG: hypothetical protein H5U08_14505, partial [Thermogutta sp.]|uniref:hypothetical protein n=1 Tax=Thermogutta sp. TaxID=1962930 RepID=UPI0019913640